MSNPTTPFSWQMPTATDLVTDLPADFEVFGQAVATSMADLLGGTTGQILAKNSNTDMDFIWTTANPGDITGVTAGTGISGGGTSGDVTITNSMATAIDAKGDLIAGTGADAFSRLAVGSNDQVLTADSTAATGLKWATPTSGSMTSLATGSLSSGAVTISSINQTYRSLRLVLQGVSVSSTGGVVIRVNGDSNTRYYNGSMNGSGGASFTQTFFYVSETNLSSTLFGCVIDFPEYATAMGRSGTYTFGSTTNYGGGLWVYNQTTAISSITMTDSVGSLDAGTYYLYGVK